MSPVDAKRYDGINDYPGVCHAQCVWWKKEIDYDNGTQTWHLVVAWSTSYVTSCGHDAFSGAPVTPDERFVICTYEYDTFENAGLITFRDAVGPYHGRLLTCKSTQDGRRVVAHVRRTPMHRWDMHYIAMVIDVQTAQANEVRHPSVWKSKGRRRSGKDGFDWGPSAVGISPAGDAIVCMHRTSGGITMEVLDHDEGVKYTTTNSRDVTEFFTEPGYGVDELDSMFESGDEDDGEDYDGEDDDGGMNYPNKVKLPFDVGFTDTGSHVCIVDRRPQFGSRAPRYSTVLVDIRRRRSVKLMKALALFQERGSAVKALHWVPDGVWVRGRRGVVCVKL